MSHLPFASENRRWYMRSMLDPALVDLMAQFRRPQPAIV